MSETANVRLVRCPKCENLLPEVTDYSVYQCGGCGAVLRAKNKGVDLDTLSEKSAQNKGVDLDTFSDEENIGVTVERLSDRHEKPMNVSERRIMEMMSDDGSESDARSTRSSSSRPGRRRIPHDRTEINTSKEAESIKHIKLDENHQAKIAQDFEDMTIYDNGLRPFVNEKYREKSEMDVFLRDAEVMRHTNGAPSNRSSYDYEHRVVDRSHVDGFDNLDDIEKERAELLRKLDQLNRSGDLIDKGKEKIPHDRRIPQRDPYASENRYRDASLERNRALIQNPYQTQYAEPPPPMPRQEMMGNGFYPPRYGPGYAPGYGDPSRAHMLGRGPHHAAYQIPPSHAYVSGPYMDDGMAYMDNTMEPYPSNFSHHHPSCSCYQCRRKRQMPTPILPTAYSDVTNDRIFNHHDNLSAFGLQDYSQISSNPPFRHHRSHNGQSHVRWPSDLNSEVDGFVHRPPPPRVHLAFAGKHCRPIAGGAPFLACHNCFELLILPKKVLTKNNNNSRKKMRCGACSMVIVFAVSSNNLVISLDEETKRDPVKVVGNNDVLNRHVNEARTTYSSDYYDNNSGYDSYSVDRDMRQVSTGQGRADKSAEMKKNRLSTSTYASEEDGESLAAARTNIADLSKEDKRDPPPKGSSLQEYFEHSNKYHVMERSGEGNKSGRSEHGKKLPNNAAIQKSSRKVSIATEIDLSSNEYDNNTGTTFDSCEASREGDHLRANRAAKTFFAGISENDFKDSDDSLGQDNANVTVNGHLITGRLIKKAEKLAGPILPGHYWYDFRAGFWGAIGGPCLGIIPPFIEEFNYPMPEHCAGGNTHVFVNGRELNHKDLNLLASRGLPTERDGSYIVEISGRVIDEDTGEELESLGKLAPTVEKVKHGFGMRAPKAVA